MLEAASAAGLDFLGVTDHNNIAHHASYGPGGRGQPLVIPGVEVTTYGGHWNAWGTDRWWEFREPRADAVERTMRAAAASGAVVSINHPKPFGPPWEYAIEGGFHAIEVWNGPWPRLNRPALERWDGLLRRGVRCSAVGGSDTHNLRVGRVSARDADSLGTPTTWVHADATVPSILAALREGRSFVSESPLGPQVYLDPDPGHAGRVSVEVRDGSGAALQLLGDRGMLASFRIDGPSWDATFDVLRGTRFVRAQLMSPAGDVRALTNPIWAERL